MKIAVVGAGIGGLAAAYDLLKAGHEVTIFEAASHAGGLASGFKAEGWDWSAEQFYHHWFTSDADMFNLIGELGWTDRVIIRRPYTVMYHEGRFYPFDSVLQALLFPGLGWGLRKIRFGLVGLYLRLTKRWQPLEKTTVDAWMRKWAGSRVYEQMWAPMVEGKFGERFSRQVNMAWMWARMHARTTRLATFEGGFQAFVDAFTEKLLQMGVTLRFNTAIGRIAPGRGGGVSLTLPEGSAGFDRCLVTVSPVALARMAPDLTENYLQGLLNLKSMGAVVMVLSLSHQLSREGYYWYNLPKNAGFPFLALVEHTNFLSPDYFGGDHIIYCGDYLETGHEYFNMNKEELLAKFLPSLKRINPEFQPDWVRESWLFRTAYAQPVPLVNHSKNIPPFQTPIQGLFFACMSQVYPWDRGTNFAVQIARKAAALILRG